MLDSCYLKFDEGWSQTWINGVIEERKSMRASEHSRNICEHRQNTRAHERAQARHSRVWASTCDHERGISEALASTCGHVREFVSSSWKYHHIYSHLRHDAWWITYVECNLYLFVPLYAFNLYFSREISPWPPDLANNWCSCTHMVSHKLHQQPW